MDKPLWMWAVFFSIVVALMIIDLGVMHRKDKEISVKESLKMSVFYIAVGLLYGAWIWMELGPKSGNEFLTGYIIEKTLSMDNIFVMSLIFTYFQIPRRFKHRVLFWGILGVILLRGVMIGVGAALVEQFEWVLYLFAAFLVFTGIKMLFADDEEPDISKNKVLRVMKRYLRFTDELHGNKFSVKLPAEAHSTDRKRYFTPLFAALVTIEFADVIFAVDSVPAIFAITTDPYIVYTSNIFAILGLRALYFALDAMIHRFTYLKYSLSLVLVFIGGKVLAHPLLGVEEISSALSLGVTVLILAAGVLYSLYRTSKEEAESSDENKEAA